MRRLIAILALLTLVPQTVLDAAEPDPRDVAALTDAVQIAMEGRPLADPQTDIWNWRYECVFSALKLGINLQRVCDSNPATALLGWRVRTIELRGCHNATLLTSPDGQRHYLIDSYLNPFLNHIGNLARMRAEVEDEAWVPLDPSEALKLFRIEAYCSAMMFLPGRNTIDPSDVENLRMKPAIDDWVVDLIIQCPGSPSPPGDPTAPSFCPTLTNGQQREFTVLASFDPNAKAGARGSGPEGYVSGEEPLRYAVFFENLQAATASAQEVVVKDQLDGLTLDLSTFSFGPIGFAHVTLTPPVGARNFQNDTDLRPFANLIVRTEATFDETTGVVTWRFRSLDPDTLQEPTDPLAGFLPPNLNPPEGQGSVVFTVRPKTSVPTHSIVRNAAEIVFDVNAPINTEEWLNTIDRDGPTSSVQPLAIVQGSPDFEIQWSGTDLGSGIESYSVFVSEDGGPFVPFITNIKTTSALFSGSVGKTYGFYSVAADAVGHVESAKTVAEAVTKLNDDTTPPNIIGLRSPDPNANGWNNSAVTVSFQCSDESGLTSGSPPPPTVLTLDGKAQSVTGTCTDQAGNSASFTVLDINIDQAPPVISFAGNAGSYTIAQAITMSCSATDALSGVASNTCTAASLTNVPAYTLGTGSHVRSASATDFARNNGSGSTTFSVVMPPGTLCGLTTQFIQSSSKYLALKPAQRALVDRVGMGLCQHLAAIVPRLSAAQKAGLVRAYNKGVAALVPTGWLTQGQAAILANFANEL